VLKKTSDLDANAIVGQELVASGQHHCRRGRLFADEPVRRQI